MDLRLLKEKIVDFEKNSLPEWKRIDSVFVLKKGAVCNYTTERKITLLPDEHPFKDNQY